MSVSASLDVNKSFFMPCYVTEKKRPSLHSEPVREHTVQWSSSVCVYMGVYVCVYM